MNWLSLLSVALSNSHVRSFLLGLSGVVGTYLTQYLSGQDFGPTLTPLVAAGLPVLVNALQKWLTRQSAPDAVDLSQLNLLGPLTPDQEAKLAQQGYQADDVPPETRRLMRDEIPFSLLWLVPLLWLCGQAAQAAPPTAIINGPTTGVRGEILVLDATQCDGEPTHFTWKISPELKGRKQLDVKDGGRRVQAASKHHQRLPNEHGTTSSMSRKWNCRHNALPESFFATPKRELVHRERYRPGAAARQSLFASTAVFDNRQRLRSDLGDQLPAPFAEAASS